MGVWDLDAPIETAEIAIAAAEPGEPDLATREAEYEKFVWDNLKRNYLGNYLHGMLGMTGFRLVNTPTFLPAYLHMISGSNSIVGLGLALQQVGGVISCRRPCGWAAWRAWRSSASRSPAGG